MRGSLQNTRKNDLRSKVFVAMGQMSDEVLTHTPTQIAPLLKSINEDLRSAREGELEELIYDWLSNQ